MPPPPTTIPDVFSSPSFVREANARLAEASQRTQPIRLPGAVLTCHHAHIVPGRIPAGTLSGAHQHLEIQFEFVLLGSMSFTTEGGTVVCQEGDGVFIAPRLRHSWKAMDDLLVLGVLVRADGENAHEFLRDLRAHSGNCLRFLSLPTSPHLSREMTDLLAEPQASCGPERLLATFQYWLSESLATILPDTWCGSGSPLSKSSVPHQAAICQRAVEFIQANCSHPLRVEDVAQQFGLSTRHLSRILRTHEGLSFQQLLRRFRLQHAHRLLSEGHVQSVKEAALSSGFTSPAYFTQSFAQEFQALPSQVLSTSPA